MSDVEHEQVTMDRRNAEEPQGTNSGQGLRSWLHSWGPGLGCLLAAIALLCGTGNKGTPEPAYFPMPDDLTEVQVVEANKASKIHILRSILPSERSSEWELTNGLIVQGEPRDGYYAPFQLRITVRNNSQHMYYVSAFDFSALDVQGRQISFDPQRALRTSQGLAGRWLSPGEACSGWLLGRRDDSPIVAINFNPDRFTRMTLTKADAPVFGRP